MMTDALLGSFNLAEEIERFSPGTDSAGRRAETLIKSDRLRVVLVTMRAGITWHEHTASGPITIHTLRGRLVATVDGEERELATGDLIALASGVRHAVKMLTDGAFLLTIARGSKCGGT